MKKKHIQKVVEEINSILQKELWFDFEVLQYAKNRLIIIGSINISSSHNIEIHFEDIFFISLPIEWKTDTQKTVLTVLERKDASELNMKFQVEQGYHIFHFAPVYYPDSFGCLIAAKKISYLRPQTSW